MATIYEAQKLDKLLVWRQNRSMTAEVSFAQLLLERLGAKVEPLATGSEKRADFIATVGCTSTLIEEKTKLDDPDELAERQKVLDAGQPYATHVPIKPDNRLSGITYEAAKQIATTARAVNANFRIIWFTAAGRNHEGKYRQYISTLYGKTNLVERDSARVRDCYFFHNSEFFRHRMTLDGAVVAWTNGKNLSAKLCLNTLSPHYPAFSNSAFCLLFKNAVIDPTKEESEDNQTFVADCDIDRSRSNEILEYLMRKYGTKELMNMNMGYSTVAVGVRKDDD